LGFSEVEQKYKLTNTVEEKTGFPMGNVLFRKSVCKKVERRKI
jgi:hypothetical protein